MAAAFLRNRVPPPLVTVAAGALMWLTARLVPALPSSPSGRTWFAAAIAALGVAVMLAGVVAFRIARTTVDPLHPGKARSMVVTGIYRFSRNPMYLGMLLLLVAWAILLSNLAAALVLPLFVLYMNHFQISPEEDALASRFVADFAAYRKAVRRWL
jgi:protein-S-isoprenylcysteine O-methyltransferase Ste14